MEVDESIATAEVYGQKGGFYQVKIGFPDVGLYISGIRARESSRKDRGLWVQLPSYKAGRAWISPFECSESGPFKGLINRLVAGAVANHLNLSKRGLDDGSYSTGEQSYEPTEEDWEFLNSNER